MPDLKRSRLYKGLGQMKVIVRMDDVKQDGILPQKLNAIDENLFQETFILVSYAGTLSCNEPISVDCGIKGFTVEGDVFLDY